MGVFSLYATQSSIGTGVVKTQLNGAVDLQLPANCKAILAIRPILTLVTPTAGEACMAKLSLESTELTVAPFEVLAPPVSTGLGATIGTSEVELSGPNYYIVNCPTKGGEKIKLYGTALVANTVAPYMGAQILYSTNGPSGPQRKSQVGAATSTGTTLNSEVSCGSNTFNGMNQIVEIIAGSVAAGTQAASKPTTGFMRFYSNDVLEAGEIKIPLSPIPGFLGSVAWTIGELVRFPITLAVKKSCVLAAYGTLEGVAPNAAGYFLWGAELV